MMMTQQMLFDASSAWERLHSPDPRSLSPVCLGRSFTSSASHWTGQPTSCWCSASAMARLWLSMSSVSSLCSWSPSAMGDTSFWRNHKSIQKTKTTKKTNDGVAEAAAGKLELARALSDAVCNLLVGRKPGQQLSGGSLPHKSVAAVRARQHRLVVRAKPSALQQQ